jgi:hypothetical protein
MQYLHDEEEEHGIEGVTLAKPSGVTYPVTHRTIQHIFLCWPKKVTQTPNVASDHETLYA